MELILLPHDIETANASIATQKLMAVDVELGKGQVRMGRPVPLFQTGVRASIGGGGYDVTRDGRFLLLNSTTESPAPLTLVTNWDAELKK